ncbi:MAG: AAA family ATPase [Clostridia bacterium]
MLIFIAGVSGSGKDTIILELLKRNKNLKRLVSCVTRPPRTNELLQKKYYYISEKEFFDKVANNEFFEYTQLHSHWCGVLKKDIANAKTELLIKDIDVNGQRSFKSKCLNVPILSVFLDVSKTELKKRLIARGEKDIELRLSRFDYENQFKQEFDLVVKNLNMEKTIQIIENKIKQELLKRLY